MLDLLMYIKATKKNIICYYNKQCLLFSFVRVLS